MTSKEARDRSDAAVKWSDLDFGHDGNSVVIKTNWMKASLKAPIPTRLTYNSEM